MSKEKLHLVDPYQEEQRTWFLKGENQFLTEFLKSLDEMRSKISKDDYLHDKKHKNEIEEDLFTEKDSKITDFCHLHGEKDIKIGKITLPFSKKGNKRKIILLATQYAMIDLGLEEVFVEVDPEEAELMQFLSSMDYENLGLETGKILFLKEKEENTVQRMIA